MLDPPVDDAVVLELVVVPGKDVERVGVSGSEDTTRALMIPAFGLVPVTSL